MKKEDIKLGKRYRINSVEADGVTPWTGTGKVLEFNPKNFPKRTVLIECADGAECCFGYEEVIEEYIPTVTEFIGKVLEVCKEYGYSISHEDDHGAFAIEKYNDICADWFSNALDFTEK